VLLLDLSGSGAVNSAVGLIVADVQHSLGIKRELEVHPRSGLVLTRCNFHREFRGRILTPHTGVRGTHRSTSHPLHRLHESKGTGVGITVEVHSLRHHLLFVVRAVNQNPGSLREFHPLRDSNGITEAPHFGSNNVDLLEVRHFQSPFRLCSSAFLNVSKYHSTTTSQMMIVLLVSSDIRTSYLLRALHIER
jgi:hypothetical protein